jgi:hypothetical protein
VGVISAFFMVSICSLVDFCARFGGGLGVIRGRLKPTFVSCQGDPDLGLGAGCRAGWRVGTAVRTEFMLNRGHSMPYGLMFAQVMSRYRVCVRILPLGVLRENRRGLRFGWGRLDHRWTLLGRRALLAPDNSPSSS